MLQQVNKQSATQRALQSTGKLALYDQYSSLAYGIILRIIPEPELAQAVLIELFLLPQLKACTETPSPAEIIRLARSKALAARPVNTNTDIGPTLLPSPSDTTSTAKFVFNLSFCQGYTPESIAEKLKLSRTNVLKAFHTYFNYLRSS